MLAGLLEVAWLDYNYYSMLPGTMYGTSTMVANGFIASLSFIMNALLGFTVYLSHE